jgi:hypothetical protein
MNSRFAATTLTRAAVLALPLAGGCNGSHSVAGNPPADRTAAAPTSTTAAQETHKAWGRRMSKTKTPGKGCYRATHPSTTWEEVPCTAPPAVPLVPSRLQVGNGGTADFSSTTATNISYAQGSFPVVTGMTEQGAVGGSALMSDYSLQLNTNYQSNTPICNGGPNASACQAWQQFVYWDGEIYIQYWLINYFATAPASPSQCPNGSIYYDNGYYVGTTVQHQYDCYFNSPTATPTPKVYGGTDLADLYLSAYAGSDDGILLYYAGTMAAYTPGTPSMLGLDTWWRTAEFNVFGPGDGSAAVFNVGTTMGVQTITEAGTTNAPSCTAGSYTGEINNLNLVPSSCCPVSGDNVGIFFTQSNAPGAIALPCPLPQNGS